MGPNKDLLPSQGANQLSSNTLDTPRARVPLPAVQEVEVSPSLFSTLSQSLSVRYQPELLFMVRTMTPILQRGRTNRTVRLTKLIVMGVRRLTLEDLQETGTCLIS